MLRVFPKLTAESANLKQLDRRPRFAIALSSTADQPMIRRLDQWQVGAINKEIAKYSDTFASHRAAYTECFRNADLDDGDWPGA